MKNEYAESYISGFNVGFMLGTSKENDDLFCRMDLICSKDKDNAFAKGFHKGFWEARSRTQTKKREISLQKILQRKSKNSPERGR